MKKLNRKKGFTLVECVVAMAVFAIMSLLLTMMLSISVQARNKNMSIEKDIDSQVKNIASDNKSSSDKYNSSIEFKQGGAVIDSIPKDGTGNLEAKKDTYKGEEVNLGTLEYNFNNYTGWGSGTTSTVFCSECKISYETSKLLENGKKCPLGHILVKEQNIEQEKVRGAVDTDKVHLNIVKEAPETYCMTVSFNAKSVGSEKALKITVPSSIERIIAPTVTGTIRAYVISKNSIRIEPKNAGDVLYKFSFTISDENYSKDFEYLSKFYTGVGQGNDIYLYRVPGTERFSPNPQNS